ncbi:catalase family protein [Mucilaginibacter sp.]|uniref:catalase family protein n=1 Tax=Mucilaginibacter sp. TaxID=1882438 RepID=UPI00260B4B64|nr:catalase family protein [Mucilaginibacter sp.]MDB5127080.1 hypothetical protein [Mucilaginibacter sp.]
MNTLITDQNSPAQERAIQKLIEMLKAKMLRENLPGQMKRDAHPKMIGLLRAEFIIEKNLPDELKVGIFASQNTHPAWIRFSNQQAPATGDNVRDIRGMAIKLLDVKGQKILDGQQDGKTHDFITITTDAFVAKDIVDFADLIAALVTSKFHFLWYLLTNPQNLWNLLRANKRFGSLLEAHFFSVSPYAFGDRVVKYSVKPQSDHQTPVAAGSAQNYLTTVMEKQLTEKDYYFDFLVQFDTNSKKTPIEDLSVRWKEKDAPFIKLATIKIPMQKFDNEAQRAFGDQLSFNPWRCLPEHTPLGSVNRARKIIYQTLSQFRHNKNKLIVAEPDTLEIP